MMVYREEVVSVFIRSYVKIVCVRVCVRASVCEFSCDVI